MKLCIINWLCMGETVVPRMVYMVKHVFLIKQSFPLRTFNLMSSVDDNSNTIHVSVNGDQIKVYEI